MSRPREKGTVYQRGRVYWLDYRVNGRRIQESAGTGDERAARALLAQRRREIRDGTWTSPEARGGRRELTVERYAETWIERREAGGVVNWRDEQAWIGKWLLPAYGSRRLRDVTRDDVRELVAALQRTPSEATGRPYAARTVLHAYNTVRLMFSDAEAEGLIDKTPCTLRKRRGELPARRDADPEWRAGAVFGREEIEALISDVRVPWDRRVYYALGALAGLRAQEIQGRRWRDLDTSAQPLGRLLVHSQAEGEEERETKTGDVRAVPVHPTLAAILAEWKLGGFPMLFGRPPLPDDFIVPSRRGIGIARTKTMLVRTKRDLDRLGLRTKGRGRHALRATFLTLLEASGANMTIAAKATHRTPVVSGALAGYLRAGWSDLCAEVAKLPIERRREAVVVPIRRAVGAGADGDNRGDSPLGSGATEVVRPTILGGSWAFENRGDWIRTSDPHTPSMVR